MSNPFSSNTTSKSNQSGTNVGSFSNPLVQNFQNSLIPQLQSAFSQAQQPVYGQAQQAGFLNSLNELANSSINNLKSSLARSGALNSGRLASGITSIDTNKMGQASNFFSQIPFLNRQATMQALPGLFGAANQFMSTAPRTATSTNTGYSKQTYNPSIMSDIGQGLGIAGDIVGMPGLGGFMGGGGGGGAPMFDPSGLSGYGAPIGGPAGGPNVVGAGWGGSPGGGTPWWLSAIQNNPPVYGGQ